MVKIYKGFSEMKNAVLPSDYQQTIDELRAENKRLPERLYNRWINVKEQTPKPI